MRMFSLLLALPLALVMVLSMSQLSLAKDVHQGKIVFAAGNKLVITDADEVNEVFVVAEDAKITLNGKDAVLSDLSVGDAVKVTAKRKEGKLLATVISARTDL